MHLHVHTRKKHSEVEHVEMIRTMLHVFAIVKTLWAISNSSCQFALWSFRISDEQRDDFDHFLPVKATGVRVQKYRY